MYHKLERKFFRQVTIKSHSLIKSAIKAKVNKKIVTHGVADF